VSRPDPLPEPVRRAVEDRRATEPDRRIDIVVEIGVGSPGAGLDPERARAAVARVDGGAEVTALPLVGAVACALRPSDVLRLADDPAVARITLDRPEAVELGQG
jgi:hypothetical protein